MRKVRTLLAARRARPPPVGPKLSTFVASGWEADWDPVAPALRERPAEPPASTRCHRCDLTREPAPATDDAGRCAHRGDGHPLDHRRPGLRRRHRSRSPRPRSRASRTSCSGAIPGVPQVHLHNPVLAYENGDEFLEPFHAAAEGRARARSSWWSKARSPTRRTRPRATGPRSAPTRDRPADHHLRVDRPAGAAGLGRGRGRHLRHLRRHPRDGGQPDRLHGPARLPRLGLAVEGRHADRLRARLPGAAGQLHGDAALPALPGGRAARR